MTGSDSFSLRPIGHVECPWLNPSSLPRQPGATCNFAFIRWLHGYELQLQWPQKIGLLFSLHQNPIWKPLVLPPRGSQGKKKGVFATRSPYRPNQIGFSVVNATSHNDAGLWIENHDLIHGTPILSIEEIPFSSNANSGWIQNINLFRVEFEPLAQEQLQFLQSLGEFELKSAIATWLTNDPLNTQEKRVLPISTTTGVYSYRTWRVDFELIRDQVSIRKIFSGYTKDELRDLSDPYFDKQLHRKFVDIFDR